MNSIKVWDSATRLFHWALVICILGAWVTIENRWITAHEIFGLIILGLVAFRLCWGFIGSTTARFNSFITKPTVAIKYLNASLRSESEHFTGHNPSGGWMVLGLLALLLFQSISGLYSNDDLGFTGPLADSISKELSDLLTGWHALSFNLILLAIWVHLVAVFFYVLVKKDNLVKAMITGKKHQDKTGRHEDLQFSHPIKAVVVALLIALIIYFYL